LRWTFASAALRLLLLTRYFKNLQNRSCFFFLSPGSSRPGSILSNTDLVPSLPYSCTHHDKRPKARPLLLMAVDLYVYIHLLAMRNSLADLFTNWVGTKAAVLSYFFLYFLLSFISIIRLRSFKDGSSVRATTYVSSFILLLLPSELLGAGGDTGEGKRGMRKERRQRAPLPLPTAFPLLPSPNYPPPQPSKSYLLAVKSPLLMLFLDHKD